MSRTVCKNRSLMTTGSGVISATLMLPESHLQTIGLSLLIRRRRWVTAAVFYSISNTQQGLQGVSFGNFLIKRVVQLLRRDLPGLKTFVTLSPVPGLRRYLENLPLATRNELIGESDASRISQAGNGNDLLTILAAS